MAAAKDSETTPTGCLAWLKKVPIWLGLRYNEGIRWHHALTFYFAVLFGITVFVFTNAVQTFLLKTVLGVPSDQIGDVSGNLQLADELVSIFALAIWGIVSDRIGRAWVYAGGFLISALAMCLMPISKDVYPDYISYRLVFAVGAGAIGSMVTAVLSDYAHPSARGRVAGFVGLSAGLGALLGVFGFLPIAEKNGGTAASIKTSYWIVGGVAAVIAVGLYFLLPKQTVAQKNAVSQKGSFWFLALAKEGIVACKDPRVFLAYCAGFVARGSSIVNSVFIPVWVLKYYESQGLCKPTDEAGTECGPAISRTAALTGVVNVLALVGAPIFGFLTDRLGPRLESKENTTWEEVDPETQDTPATSRSGSHTSSEPTSPDGSPAPLLGNADDKRDQNGNSSNLNIAYGTNENLKNAGEEALVQSEVHNGNFGSENRSNPPNRFGKKRMERDRSWGVLVASVVGFFGFGAAYFLKNVDAGFALGVAALFGFSQIGMVVTSSALVAQVSPRDVRGSIAGMFSLLGGLGILVCSKLGGYLADSWTPAAPFLVLALFHGLVVLISLPIAVITLVRTRRERRNLHSA